MQQSGHPPEWSVAETVRKILVSGMIVLVTVAIVTGIGAADTDGSNHIEASMDAESTDAVDVVVVFDRSESMNGLRYDIASAMTNFDDRFDHTEVDLRYALITYGATTEVRQPPSGDYDEFQQALDFDTAKSTERAAGALLAATNVYRPESNPVVILVTNEDDDSKDATRRDAVQAMSSVTFHAISPADPAASSCAIHSPPCDNASTNELREVATSANGKWTDVDTSADTIVDAMASTIVESTAVTAPESTEDASGIDAGDRISRSHSNDDGSPSIDPVSGSVNRSPVEIGEPVQISIAVENDGTDTGTTTADLRTEDGPIASPVVNVPEDDSRTINVTHTFEEPGEYALFYDHMRVGTVEVTPLRDAVVTLSATNESILEATVTDARAGEPLRIPLAHPEIADTAFGPATAIWVRPTQDSTYTLSVSPTNGPTNASGPFAEHVAPRAWLSVNASLDPSADTRTIAVEFANAEETIEFYRLSHDSNWVTQEGYDLAAATTERSRTNATVDANETGTQPLDLTWNGTPAHDATGVQYEVCAPASPSTNTTVDETASMQENATPSTVVETVHVPPNGSQADVTFASTGVDRGRSVVAVPEFSTFAFGEGVADISVGSLTLSESSIEVGDVVTATITVTNEGLAPGDYDVHLDAGDERIAETTISVEPGQTRERTFSFSPDSAGEYTLAMNGGAETRLSVEASESAEPTTTTPGTQTSSPGFGTIPVLGALAVTVVLVLRRR